MSTSTGLYRHEVPLREIVSDSIRRQILSGDLVPGTRLVERELADRYEVSRFPVREALRMLSREGFVENLATRGIVVKKFRRQEVEEIFDLRELLEGLASRQAAVRVASGAPSDLGRLVEESRAAVQNDDLDEAHRANSAFHDEIIAASGNETLHVVLAPLIGRLHWIFRQISDFDRVSDEHAKLCAAIESGDPARAETAAKKHVLSYRRRTLDYLFD